MTQQREPAVQSQDESPAAPASDRNARRISVIESVDLGIKVRDGDGFDPHRFQEFDFTPEFRQKIMRASLPLLDLRPLLEGQPGHFNWRHASPNDITRLAGNNPPSNDASPIGPGVALSNSNDRAPTFRPQASSVENDASDASTQSTTRLPSNAMQHALAGRKLRKGSNRRLDGTPAKKWKLLLFGSSLVMATFLSLAQSQGPALASTTPVGRFPVMRSHAPQQVEATTAAALPRLQTSLAHLTEQTSKATAQSKVTRTTGAASKPAPKTLWLPAE
jgi:hypothetical protein